MNYTSLNSVYQTSLINLLNDARGNSATNLNNDLYLARALEAYIWGYSFQWFYTKMQQQTYGAAGSRDVSTPVNSFYINQTPTAVSTGDVAPDVAVLYANAFLSVSEGNPVVVQFPDSSLGNQFVMMQVSNSATENIASPSSYINTNGHSGGNILFYAEGDPNLASYTGNFIQKIALNTKLALATGRVLVDPALTSEYVNTLTDGQSLPFSLENSYGIAKQFVAATYKAYVDNGYSMEGLSNSGSTEDTSATTAAYELYTSTPNSLNFWKFLGEALVQSPLPTVGIGSESNLYNLSPTQYLATLKDLGLSASGWNASQLNAQQLADLALVAKFGYQLIQDALGLGAVLGTENWSSPPSNLGSYPNNLIGYLERDIAHIANSPITALYPVVYKDCNGNSLAGSNTYTITLKNVNGAPNLPPLAQPSQGEAAVANSTGFWAFNAYDKNSNITPAVSGYSSYVNNKLGYTPLVTNSVTGSVNYTVSSVLLPSSNVVPASNQLKFEVNGDLVFILSPEAPKDESYVNNWIPTPLVTYDNTVSSFTSGDAFSMMLRVYSPNISTTLVNGVAVLIDGSGSQWVIPQVVRSDGLANASIITGGKPGTNATFYDSARADQIHGTPEINTMIYLQPSTHYNVHLLTNGIVSIANLSNQVKDSLSSIERLKFPDINIALDISPTQNAGSLYMLYMAAFNRAPDAEGLGYWLAQVDSGKNTVTEIAASFMKTPEFVAIYGANPTNSYYVNELYQNVLGRTGEVKGLNYWIGEMDAGRVSKAQALVEFATLPEGAGLVASLIANGIHYQQWVE